jgi:hypothetical protein
MFLCHPLPQPGRLQDLYPAGVVEEPTDQLRGDAHVEGQARPAIGQGTLGYASRVPVSEDGRQRGGAQVARGPKVPERLRRRAIPPA